MAWHTGDGSTLYSGGCGSPPCDSGWVDLDVSSQVGTNSALVLLQWEAGGAFFSSRPKGDSENWLSSENDSSSTNFYSGGGQTSYVLARTNSAGLLERRVFSLGAPDTLKYFGYLDIEDASTQVYSGEIPAAWTDLDLSSVVGTNKALVFLRQEFLSGTNRRVGYRRKGDTVSFVSSSVEFRGGISNAQIDTIGGLIALTDENGVVQFAAPQGANNYQIDVLGYTVSGWNEIDVSLQSAVSPPVIWTDIDLSSYVGPNSVPVLLSVELIPTGSGDEKISFNTKGRSITVGATNGGVSSVRPIWTAPATNAAEVVLVETDSNGVIQWISDGGTGSFNLRLLGALDEADSPTVTNYSNFVTPQTQNENISFSLVNSFPGISQTTIDVTLTDPNGDTHAVIVNGVFQTGYAGTIASDGSNGFDITISTYPDIIGSWTVDVYAEDFFGS